MDAERRKGLLAEIVTCRKGRVKVIIAQLMSDLTSELWLEATWGNYKKVGEVRVSGRTVLTNPDERSILAS